MIQRMPKQSHRNRPSEAPAIDPTTSAAIAIVCLVIVPPLVLNTRLVPSTTSETQDERGPGAINDQFDAAVLVSADSDFVPAVEPVQRVQTGT